MTSFLIKKAKYESQIKRTLSNVIESESYDLWIKQIIITKVLLNNDFSIAKVYISVLDRQKFDIILEKANSALGFFKKMLAINLDYKKIPKLIFLRDESLENIENIEKILKEIKG